MCLWNYIKLIPFSLQFQGIKFIINTMPFLDDKKILPFPVLLMLICTGVLSVLLVFNLPPMPPQDRQFIKGVILALIVGAGGYFFLRFLGQKLKRLPGVASQHHVGAKDDAPAPQGYKREVVQKERFSFCYPQTWQLVPPSDPSLYMEAREVTQDKSIHTLRNFNIASQDITKALDLDYLFRSIREAVLQVLKGGKVEFQQNFRMDKLSGMRYKVNYSHPLLGDLSCYQVALTNENKRRLLMLTFTCAQADYWRSKKMFDEIAANISIFD